MLFLTLRIKTLDLKKWFIVEIAVLHRNKECSKNFKQIQKLEGIILFYLEQSQYWTRKRW